MRKLSFNFREWMSQIPDWLMMLEAVAPGMVIGPPVALEFPNGEFSPPVDRNSGKQYQGPGLICFDFDQTITNSFWAEPKVPGQKSSSRSSDSEPNPEIAEKLRKHKSMGNAIHVLTARGVEEDKTRADKRHVFGVQPVIGTGWDKEGRATALDKDISGQDKWSHLHGLDPQKDFSFMGGVKNATTDPKGPRIAHLMLQRKHQWAILYDDGPSNIKSCQKMQSKGWAIHGILVKPNARNPEIGPEDFSAGMSHSGM